MEIPGDTAFIISVPSNADKWLAGLPVKPVVPVHKGMLSDSNKKPANGLNLTQPKDFNKFETSYRGLGEILNHLYLLIMIEPLRIFCIRGKCRAALSQHFLKIVER